MFILLNSLEIVITAFVIFMLIKSYKKKQECGIIIIKANSNYINKTLLTLSLLIATIFFILSFHLGGRYNFPVVILVLISVFINSAYLGEHGLKVSDRFIPKKEIIKYSFVERNFNSFEIELTIEDFKKPIKLKVHEKNKTKLISSLEEYFKPILNDV